MNSDPLQIVVNGCMRCKEFFMGKSNGKKMNIRKRVEEKISEKK
jgi:hypothetical protein